MPALSFVAWVAVIITQATAPAEAASGWGGDVNWRRAFDRVYSKSCVITDYGAQGDDSTDNTKFIQSAIDDCVGQAGTSLVVPKGIFRTYSLTVEKATNFTILLDDEAVLRGGTLEGWPHPHGAVTDFITISNSHQVDIAGGLIDGGGTDILRIII